MNRRRAMGFAVAIGTIAPVLLAVTPRPVQAQEDCVAVSVPAGTRILVFTRTAGYRHPSIPDGVAAIRRLGERYGFVVEETADAAEFRDERLSGFAAVVFLSTTGDLLDEAQQAALQRYIRRGGGFVGVHAAADAEYDWPWYRSLVGAYFRRHPPIQQAVVRVVDNTHPSTACVPQTWTRTDEWYDYDAAPAADVKILATLDESSYRGGQMGDSHPIAWYHEFDGGRAWYTGLGHTAESYQEPEFLNHLAGGILWAAGGSAGRR